MSCTHRPKKGLKAVTLKPKNNHGMNNHDRVYPNGDGSHTTAGRCLYNIMVEEVPGVPEYLMTTSFIRIKEALNNVRNEGAYARRNDENTMYPKFVFKTSRWYDDDRIGTGSNLYDNIKDNTAAVTLQAAWRRLKAKRQTKVLHDKAKNDENTIKAIVKIQAIARKFIVRKYFTDEDTQLTPYANYQDYIRRSRMELSATIIQKTFRGFKVKKAYKRKQLRLKCDEFIESFCGFLKGIKKENYTTIVQAASHGLRTHKRYKRRVDRNNVASYMMTTHDESVIGYCIQNIG